jgi:hypothetical protein
MSLIFHTGRKTQFTLSDRLVKLSWSLDENELVKLSWSLDENELITVDLDMHLKISTKVLST